MLLYQPSGYYLALYIYRSNESLLADKEIHHTALISSLALFENTG
ncbi:Hypothetical protein LOCK900_0023 [Lacticaseibacillus rhamnosus LOCK900]|nr:Hypothetical protein LOCK900_0023 [Lacticaseibacillus rhamnosus LOCK900]EHJ35863.1 hypothetical protein HMPREF0541_00210 [Lacticaseibacillus rhamnosus ATCC 21052]